MFVYEKIICIILLIPVLALLISCGSTDYLASAGQEDLQGMASLKGAVFNNSGNSLSGVVVKMSGSINASAVTDANGNYVFTRIKIGTYDMVPEKTGYCFTPVSNSITVEKDVEGLNFLGEENVWSKTISKYYNTEASSVTMSADGCYVIAGYASSPSAMNDLYLVKLSPAGKILWEKTYGGIYNEEARCVITTADGGFMAAGYTSSYTVGGSDLWLVKLDAAGGLVWSQSFGTVNADEAYEVIQTVDGGYVAAGHSRGTGNNSSFNYWVLKVD